MTRYRPGRTVGKAAELKQATDGFLQRVTQDLLVRYPTLDENPAAAHLMAPVADRSLG